MFIKCDCHTTDGLCCSSAGRRENLHMLLVRLQEELHENSEEEVGDRNTRSETQEDPTLMSGH